MCAVSVITDYGMRQNIINGDTQKLIDFYDLIIEAQQFDTKHGEPSCEAPDKKEWIDQLRQKLNKTE